MYRYLRNRSKIPETEKSILLRLYFNEAGTFEPDPGNGQVRWWDFVWLKMFYITVSYWFTIANGVMQKSV